MRIYLLLINVLFLVSCTKEVEIPKDILGKEKMVKILVDIHLAEARVSVKNLPSDTSKKLFDAYQMAIYKAHTTDSTKFKKSYRYYLNENVKKMDEIYAAVVDTLGAREARKKLD